MNASKYMRYDDSMLLSQLFIYLLFALAYLCITLHIPPPIPFSAINNISIYANNSNFPPDFLKQSCHLNPGADKNKQDQVYIFQCTCF